MKTSLSAPWIIDDPGQKVTGMGLELNLNTASPPTTIDFGAGSLVYAQLRKGTSAMLRAGPRANTGDTLFPKSTFPLWETLRGPTGKLEPFVISSQQFPNPAEGWAHVMDAERCSAVALAEFGGHSKDNIEVSHDGRLQVKRIFERQSNSPQTSSGSIRTINLPRRAIQLRRNKTRTARVPRQRSAQHLAASHGEFSPAIRGSDLSACSRHVIENALLPDGRFGSTNVPL